MSMWSVVALFFLPPAWFSLLLTFVLTLSFMILSKTLPTLLARVIPLSFEHFSFFPLPLYSLTIFPVRHCEGISFVFAMLLRTSRYFSMVSVLASMNISFGISSGPMAFPLFSFLIASVISFVVTSCVGLFISVDSASLFLLFAWFLPSSLCILVCLLWLGRDFWRILLCVLWLSHCFQWCPRFLWLLGSHCQCLFLRLFVLLSRRLLILCLPRLLFFFRYCSDFFSLSFFHFFSNGHLDVKVGL